jgi:hypothetical protein
MAHPMAHDEQKRRARTTTCCASPATAAAVSSIAGRRLSPAPPNLGGHALKYFPHYLRADVDAGLNFGGRWQF